MKKISKKELLAILAATGMTGSAAIAANLDSDNGSSLGKLEHSQAKYLGTEESKCGKGSCGKDEKGAAAAKEKHEKKEVKKEAKKGEKKAEKKAEEKKVEEKKSEEKKEEKK